MVAALTQVLADELQVDYLTPEPLVASRALIGLVELLYDSRLRHASAGHTPRELQDLVNADIERGARLLETGVWSLQLLVEGRRSKDQMREAAAVAEHARQQVMTALRIAKRSLKDARDEAHAAGREAGREAAREVARGAAREVRQHAAQLAREVAREAHQQAREAQRQKHQQAREAQRQKQQQAMESRRQTPQQPKPDPGPDARGRRKH
jgi:Sec-independent protein translocase protein TatA